MTQPPDGSRPGPANGVTLDDSDANVSGDLILGKTLGGYELLEVIAQGGMGVVYRARQASVGRDVAVKILRRRFAGDEKVARRFENEARIISRLRHPCTLRLYDCQRTSEGNLFIVTELLQGRSLESLLAEGALPIERAIHIADQVAASLSEAHAAGIVHRDLKPENIFLERIGSEDFVKVLDFGIAKLVHERRETLEGALLGTPYYMSPEQAAGEAADHRADIYALGVVLYHMVSGAPPFSGHTPFDVLMMHIHEDAPAIWKPSTPTEEASVLEALIMEMLAKSPADRPASIDVVRERLLAIEELARATAAEVQRIRRPSSVAPRAPEPAPTLVDRPVVMRATIPVTLDVAPTTEDPIPEEMHDTIQPAIAAYMQERRDRQLRDTLLRPEAGPTLLKPPPEITAGPTPAQGPASAPAPAKRSSSRRALYVAIPVLAALGVLVWALFARRS